MKRGTKFREDQQTSLIIDESLHPLSSSVEIQPIHLAKESPYDRRQTSRWSRYSSWYTFCFYVSRCRDQLAKVKGNFGRYKIHNTLEYRNSTQRWLKSVLEGFERQKLIIEFSISFIGKSLFSRVLIVYGNFAFK